MGTTQTNPGVDPLQATRELTKPGPGDKSIKGLLQSDLFKKQVAAALPKHLTPDRFIRIAVNATLQKPELLECNKESFFLALLQLSSYGIEADGRRAHLIPYYDNNYCRCNHKKEDHRGGKCSRCECNTCVSRRVVNLIIDYKGIAELVRRSGDVSYIHADIVLDGDDWDFQFGSQSFLRHKPNLQLGQYDPLKPNERRILAVYSYVKFKDGTEDFIVISKADVDAIRKRSKTPDAGPWKSDYLEMAKKTVFRRHSKWLPLSPDVHDAMATEDGGDLSDAGAILDGALQFDRDDEHQEVEPKEETLADRVAKAKDAQKPKPDPKPEATSETTSEAEPSKKQPPKKMYDYVDWESAQESKDWDKEFVKIAGIVYQSVDGNWQPWKG